MEMLDSARAIGRRAIAKDLILEAQWLCAPWKRRDLIKQLNSCRDSHDLLVFCRALLACNQIEEEILPFIDLARSSSPRTVIEIGTAAGGTNLLLSWAIETTRHIVGIDRYVKNRAQLRTLQRPDTRVSLIRGSSYASKTIAKVERALRGAPIDVLFIDGAHGYRRVRADFTRYCGLVRDGGIVAFHDICPDGRDEGEHPLGWSGGVPELWSELRDQYSSREFIADPSQRGYGIGVLIYSSGVEPKLNPEKGEPPEQWPPTSRSPSSRRSF